MERNAPVEETLEAESHCVILKVRKFAVNIFKC